MQFKRLLPLAMFFCVSLLGLPAHGADGEKAPLGYLPVGQTPAVSAMPSSVPDVLAAPASAIDGASRPGQTPAGAAGRMPDMAGMSMNGGMMNMPGMNMSAGVSGGMMMGMPGMSAGAMMNMPGMGQPAIFSQEFNWKITPQSPLQPNQAVTLAFDINWKKDGQPLADLALLHGKPCHLIIVSKDLSIYEHIHPDIIGPGKMRITTRFPRAGSYVAFLQYAVRNVGYYTLRKTIDVGSASMQPAKLAVDSGLAKIVEPMNIIGNDGAILDDKADQGKHGYTLKLVRFPLNVGRESFMLLSVEHNGKPVQEIQPFLETGGHGALVSDDLTQFLHIHPATTLPFGQTYTSPISFYISKITKPGLYKTWLQVKIDGKMVVGCWSLKVQ